MAVKRESVSKTFLPVTLVVWVVFAVGCDLRGDYYQCVSSSQATEDQKRACMKQFQTQIPGPVSRQIEGRGSFRSWGSFDGDLRNQSSDWLVTELVVALRPNGWSGPEYQYRAFVEVEPLSVGSFSIKVFEEIEPSDEFSWGIQEVYGIKAN